MIVCFQCPRDTKRKLDALVSESDYSDLSEVLNAAIDAFLLLNQQVSSNGHASIHSPLSDEPAGAPEQDRSDPDRFPGESVRLMEPVPRESVRIIRLKQGLAPPPTYADYQLPRVSAPPLLTDWLFGQYNKLLPVKTTCRLLANLGQEYPEGFLSDSCVEITDYAARVGDLLRAIDQSAGLKRAEALGAAFPMRGRKGDGSRKRFGTQFCATLDKDGRIRGLPASLGLLGRLEETAPPRFQLTETGWRFAQLPNPVLDGEYSGEKFSPEELSLLRSHIQDSVPLEHHTFLLLLGLIASGYASPSELDSSLAKQLPEEKRAEVSSSFLSTQRSGAISRMVDLRLLERQKEGTSVTYALTADGEAYLATRSEQE